MPNDSAIPAVGTVFPDLLLVDAHGAPSRLSEARDRHTAVVHFMRSASCAVCLNHAAVLDRMRESGQIPRVELVFIAPGGTQAAADVTRRLAGRGITVRASDDAHPSLGLGRFLAMQHSGTFVLAADGSVLSAVSSVMPTASFSRAKTIEALRS